MKTILLLVCGSVLLSTIYSCSGTKKTGAAPSGNADAKDSAVWYNAEIGTIQKSYKKELQGKWTISVMHRQQKAVAEKLNDASITFADSSFLGKAPCNTIAGEYILKGTSIRFIDIVSTKMACPQLEQESIFLKLLQETVSAYSVSEKKLYLRDGASNIVFECDKE